MGDFGDYRGIINHDISIASHEKVDRIIKLLDRITNVVEKLEKPVKSLLVAASIAISITTVTVAAISIFKILKSTSKK